MAVTPGIWFHIVINGLNIGSETNSWIRFPSNCCRDFQCVPPGKKYKSKNGILPFEDGSRRRAAVHKVLFKPLRFQREGMAETSGRFSSLVQELMNTGMYKNNAVAASRRPVFFSNIVKI
jgi:hypothetical protein